MCSKRFAITKLRRLFSPRNYNQCLVCSLGCLIGFICLFAEPLRYRVLDTHGPRLDHQRHGAVAGRIQCAYAAPWMPIQRERSDRRTLLFAHRTEPASRPGASRSASCNRLRLAQQRQRGINATSVPRWSGFVCSVVCSCYRGRRTRVTGKAKNRMQPEPHSRFVNEPNAQQTSSFASAPPRNAQSQTAAHRGDLCSLADYQLRFPGLMKNLSARRWCPIGLRSTCFGHLRRLGHHLKGVGWNTLAGYLCAVV